MARRVTGLDICTTPKCPGYLAWTRAAMSANGHIETCPLFPRNGTAWPREA